MNTMLEFAALLIVTLAVGALALALDWLLLRAAFVLMQPAGAARPATAPPAIAGLNRSAVPRLAA